MPLNFLFMSIQPILPASQLSAVVSEPTTLTNCDRELIHIPGSIQPHGALITLEPETLRILQVSQNINAVFGIAATDLINQLLSDLLSKRQIEQITSAIGCPEKHDEPPIFLTLPIKEILSERASNKSSDHVNSQEWLGLVRVQPDVVIIELSPQTIDETLSVELYDVLNRALQKFHQATTLSQLTQDIVEIVRELTDFDRVMVYQFASDDSGCVVAEDINPGLDSFLNLHYPASDIPVQARQLYTRNWLRVIPDAAYQPVPLIPEMNPLTQSPLDLSAVEIRSVSPMHTEYLQNIGANASMSVSLIVEQGLWGLIACHHGSPKYPDYKTRKACELLGKIASTEIFNQQVIAEKRYQNQVHAIQRDIRNMLSSSQTTHTVRSILKHYRQELLELVQANGAVIILDDHLTSIGTTPDDEDLSPLLEWLVEQGQEVYSTHALSQEFAAAHRYRDVASGLLAISIFLNETTYHILWFRPEQEQLVTWAGDPRKLSTETDEDGEPYLTPRQSFERWRENVYEQAVPWQAIEIAAAQELRSTLLLAALKFSQTVLQHAAQKAQVANQAKSQFLAKMSHELRTPLNTILGFTQLIDYAENLSPKNREQLEIINRSGEHLLALINDVLETSRIEAGQLTLKPDYFDLHRLINSVREMLALRARAKHLQLEAYQMDSVPQYVYGDESKLRQILINLLSNAVKFTEQGKITLRVGCVYRDALPHLTSNQVQLEFQVIDTGLGIEQTQLDSIFEPFRQTPTGRQAHEGTGLGLWISQQYACLMGGELNVQSQLGIGSTFSGSVRLALATEADVTPLHSQQRVVGLEPGQTNWRILVVEDVEENRRLLVSLLTTIGFEVCSVDNGREAVQSWRQWNPHCIWMDVYMPYVDGYEAAQQIRSDQTPDTRPVIIALTASVLDNKKDELLAAGFDDFVHKPFHVNDIFNKLAQHLEVRYRYADKPFYSAARAEDAASPITDRALLGEEELRSHLLTLPQAWRSTFYQAARSAREEPLQQLIRQLPEQGAEDAVVRSLNYYLKHLQFNVLAELVQPEDSFSDG